MSDKVSVERHQGRRFGILTVAVVASCCRPAVSAHLSVDEAIRKVTGRGAETRPTSQAAARADDLEILSARYGASGRWVDVTGQARARVRDGRLTLRAGNELAGDPIFNVPKVLAVEYRVAGQIHSHQVAEGETLRLPLGPDEFRAWRAIRTPQQLVALAKLCPAEVGFFGKNLATGRTVEYRPDQPFCLASIVKLFVLAEVIRQAEEGSLKTSESIIVRRDAKEDTLTIDEALDAMIGLSDNEATGALTERVGYERVNALPGLLRLSGLAHEVIPKPGVLDRVLDERLRGNHLLPSSELPPQHGTARSLVAFLELLSDEKMVDVAVSRRVLHVLRRNPKPFAARATPIDCVSVGKGGSILWLRLFRGHYNMVGWALLIDGRDGCQPVAFCVICEWFPWSVPEHEKGEWCSTLSDCIVNVLMGPSAVSRTAPR